MSKNMFKLQLIISQTNRIHPQVDMINISLQYRTQWIQTASYLSIIGSINFCCSFYEHSLTVHTVHLIKN